MSIDTRWLKDFLTLAQVNNFSKAAKLRHITQPAFGRRIKSLEQAVNKQLIDRNSTPIQLTPEGKLFRFTAKAMIQHMEQGLAELNNSQQTLFSPVQIATPHALSSPTLLELLDSIQHDAPIPNSIDVVRVDLGIKSLENGECDFFLGFDHISLLQPPFENILLGQGQMLLVSAQNKGHPLYSLDAPSVPYLRYSDESYSARLLEQHQPELPASLTPIFESSMCQLHKERVLAGKGIAWLPDVLIKNELQQQQLIPLMPSTFAIPFVVRLYRYNSQLNADAELIWQRLHQTYGKENLFCQPE